MNIFRRGQAFVAALYLSAACMMLAPAAMAQSSDIQALLDRINRLEADLNNVQRKVYQGQDVPAPNFSGTGGTAIVGGGEAAALLSTRLDALEEEQRRTTGSLEEVRFKIDQIASRFDKLVLDIDFRLTEIERRQNVANPVVSNLPVQQGGQVPVTSTAPGNGSAVAPATGAASEAQGTAQSNAGGTQGFAKGPQILGTIRVPKDTEGQTENSVPSPAVEGGANVAAVPADTPMIKNPNEQYNHAISLIRKDEFAQAEQAFTTFLQSYKEHALAGNAQYWLGETFYVRGDYANAASAFLNGYQIYPDNSKAADNLLKLAMTLGRMEQIEEACATFQQLDKQFPNLTARLKRIENREKQKFNCQ